MIRKPISWTTRVALGAASVLLLAGLYTLLSERQHASNPSDTTIPNWTQLAAGAVQTVTPDRRGDRWLWIDAKATFGRHFTGLALGVLASVVLGVAMGCYSWVEAFFEPPLSLLTKVPPTAMLAVFFVLVGMNFEMYVAMIAFGVLPTLAQAVHQSAKADVHEELIHKAYTLGASQIEVIWHVVFMTILPRVIEAVRLQVGPAMVYLLAAEMLVAEVGFGFRIRQQQRLLNMDVVYVYLAILAGSGFVMDYSLTLLRRWLCPWFKG